MKNNNQSKSIRATFLAFLIFAGWGFFMSAGSTRVSAQSIPAETRFQVVSENGVRVKMRDGVTLVADIYRPVSEGKFPVLLQRTPYNRKGSLAMAHELAEHGYVVVFQDTRGRFDSSGEFYPFMNEGQDGYDTVEWAAALKYSNGQVGMFGGSYVGATQMLAAAAKPPHLVAIFPYVTSSEYYDGWTYQSGALMQWFASSWTSSLAVDTLRRKTTERSRPGEWVARLPVESYQVLDPAPVEDLVPYFRDWLRHEQQDSYWRRWKVSDHYKEISVKGLHAGGWNDLFLKGSIKNYTGLRADGATSEVRDGQRLIIGPWAHASTSSEGKIGDITYGKSAVLDMTATTLKWFDFALKGRPNEFSTAPSVSLFVMGENRWRAENEFPLARTHYTKYFLRSDRGANGVQGDGRLDPTAPTGERPDSLHY
ncbi:MAG TPA: CocE/NonD family hydrolase, partial [Pyrinomonadaceae bacterium]|nr:CocE/NonD family hydrolase [Pyrinomonadaceae bacterium]